MAFKFPNASRSYNPTKQCVRFLGYDTVFEVSFDPDERALRRWSPKALQRSIATGIAFTDRRRGLFAKPSPGLCLAVA